MGIPRFAYWITKKFPSIVKYEVPEIVHGLYIDMNGIIHPCCHSENDPSISKRSESEKIAQVCLAVNYLLMQARPKTIVYLAMDGVAPRAKMNQQRSRRYMSAVESYGEMKYEGTVPPGSCVTDEEDALIASIFQNFPGKKDVMNEDNSPKFDSNCISPGTVFMERCANALNDHVQKMMAQSVTKEAQEGTDAVGAAWAGLTVIISDTSSPGEGEHKIMDFIRSQLGTAGNSWSGVGSHVIAGKDADLILLCLAMHTPRIHIMRENFRLARFTEDSQPFVAPNSKKSSDKSKDSQIFIKPAGGNEECNKETDRLLLSVAADDTTPTSTTPVEDTVRDVGEIVITASQEQQPGVTVAKVEENDEEDECEEKKYQQNRGQNSRKFRDNNRSRFEYYDVDALGAAIMNEIYSVSRKANVVLSQAVDYQNFIQCVHNKYDGQKKNKKVSNNVCDCDSTPISSRHPEVLNFINPEGHIEIYKEDGLYRDVISGHVLVHPCTTVNNNRVIDDFIALASLMGNDFMPRLPSAFCGDSAMDNIMEVYIHSVLPYGFLTNSKVHDFDLKQLFRFLVGYANVETALFRQQCIKANIITQDEAMNFSEYVSGVHAESSSLSFKNRVRLPSPVDAKWRDLYYNSTSITNNKDIIDTACKSFIEGMRFVFRYYTTTSKTTSWKWYYPFHHTPFAVDLANFLEFYALGDEATQRQLPPPKLEVDAPCPFAQLMAILPLTSATLLPKKLAQVMFDGTRSDDLKEAFPLEWKVDYCASSGKDYLSTVMIPFANLDILMDIVGESEPSLDDEEKIRNKNRNSQRLLLRCSRKMISLIRESAMKAAEKNGEGDIFSSTALTDVESLCRNSLKELMNRRSRYLTAATVNEATRVVKGEVQFVECRPYSLDIFDAARLQELGLYEEKELASSDVTRDDNRSEMEKVFIFHYEECHSVFNLKPKTYSYIKTPYSNERNYGGNKRNRRFNRGKRYNNGVAKKGTGYNVLTPKWFLTCARKAGILSINNGVSSSSSESLHSPSFGDCYVGIGGVVTVASVIQSLAYSYMDPNLTMLDCLWSMLVSFSVPVFVFITGLIVLFAIGFGQSSPLPSKGSGIVRNNNRDAYVDWLCSRCLSLNFTRNEKCFRCAAPCDELMSSWAIFTPKSQNISSNLLPNHAPYITTARICMSKADMIKAAGLDLVLDNLDIDETDVKHKDVADTAGNSNDDSGCDMI